MLKSVLREINDANMFSKSSIAKNLNITEGMVEEIISQLVRMGYLNEDLGSPTCDTSCGKCPYSRMCHSSPIKMLNLTDKGKKIIYKD